jgi:drug/metabolite transporter (DMT)-like permease
VSRRAALLFVAMAVIWGIPYLLIRIAVAEVSPAVLVFARTAIGAAVLLPLAIARVDLRPTLRHWRSVVAFAFVEIAGPWVLLGWAEQRVTSSLAGLMIACVPLVGTVLAVLTGTRDPHLGTRSYAGLLLGLLGVLAIAASDLDAASAGAILALVVVAVGYAVGPWILVHRLSEVPSLGVMAPSLVLTALLYAPVAVAGWPATTPSPEALVSIAVLGLVCTALAFVLFGELVAAAGPVRATVITYVNPVVASVLGVALLQEPFTPAMAVGFVLVITGSILATRRSSADTGGGAEPDVAPA